MLLDHGKVDHIGDPADCVTRYYASLGRRADVPHPTGAGDADGAAAPRQPLVHKLPEAMRQELAAHDILATGKSRHGTRELELIAATLQDEAGKHQLLIESTHLASLTILTRANQALARPSCGIHLYDRLGNLVFAAGTKQRRVTMPPMKAGDERLLTFRINLDLQPGEYTLNISCSARAEQDLPDVGPTFDSYSGLGPITVHQPPDRLPYFYGIAQLPIEIMVHD
jgi:hypothetical protein